MKMSYNEFYHHGIDGQKWGVKHGPPYPLDHQTNHKKDIVVKKGTTIQHIASNKKSKLKNKRLYTSYKEADNKLYQGHFTSMKKVFNHINKFYKYEYTATEDLISPSQEDRAKLFVTQFLNDKKNMAQYIAFIDAQAKSGEFNPQKYENMSDKELMTEAYRLFAFGLTWNNKYTSEYFSTLAKKGYNALIDDNDRAEDGFRTNSPLIVLNAKNSLFTQSVSKLSNQDIREANKWVEEHLGEEAGYGDMEWFKQMKVA